MFAVRLRDAERVELISPIKLACLARSSKSFWVSLYYVAFVSSNSFATLSIIFCASSYSL